MVRRAVLVLCMMAGLMVVGMSSAQAGFSISVAGATATIVGDASPVDQLDIGKSGVNLTHDGSVDWDAAPGDQLLPDITGIHIVINAGDGIDIINVGTPGDTFAASIDVHGEGDADFLNLNVGGSSADTVTINGNSLVGPGGGTIAWDNSTDQVNVRTGDGADVVNLTGTPNSPQVLIYAEGGGDTLKPANATGLGMGGAFRGGPGTDTVDYSAFTTPVSVDLGKTAKFDTHLSAAGTVPPSGSAATGYAEVEFTDLATNTFNYEADASGLTAADITDAHLHNAAGDSLLSIGAGTTWSDPATPETEVNGTTDADITEPALRAGTTYVDFHTTAHPTGEIRGQLTLDDDEGYGGSGTGLPRLYTVENVIGGSGNDTFKGSVPTNAFTCGAGDDTVTTGPGDTVSGCETVNGVRTVVPPPPSATPVGSVSALKPKVSAKGKKVTIDTGATAACPAAATGSCTVSASAQTKIGKKKTALGKVSSSVAAGQTLKVSLKVPKKAAAAWRKAGKLKVTLTITLTVPGGSPVTVTKTVKLKLPRP